MKKTNEENETRRFQFQPILRVLVCTYVVSTSIKEETFMDSNDP